MSPIEASNIEAPFDFARYPYVAPERPAVRGVMRRECADFQVDEVMREPPSGEGEHLHLLVEKTDLTTRRLVDLLLAAWGLNEHAIGWAGLKDRRAVTRQWISVPAAMQDRLGELEALPGVRLLDRGLDPAKLQEGHLLGNRFRILLREPTGSADAVRAIFADLAARGVPNYFGPQRFGNEGMNASRGLWLIRNGRGRSKRWLDRLLLDSLQSLLFNDWLALRLERGLFDHVIAGDVAHKHLSGGKFLVGDPTVEDPRAEAFEISATGPLFGRKYHEAQGPARAIEDEVLAHHGLQREDFNGASGTRRVSRLPLADWSVEETPEGLWLAFYLPKGAYATSVLREVMHADPEASGRAERHPEAPSGAEAEAPPPADLPE